MHFVSKILTEFVNWNIEKGQQVKMCCLVGFSEELFAVWYVKMSQIDSENDKNLKISQFSKILCIFSNFSTDVVNWNVENKRCLQYETWTVP